MNDERRVLNGRYELVREIARGGMAIVWEATDRMLGRRVAVKILHPQFVGDPEFIERFEREARSVAGLSHPNIVGIFDVGEDQASGAPFIVMELVDGESLKERIRRVGALPEAEVREIGAAVAGALDYAHRRGIIHRDVKPQNVLLGEDGRTRLTDFGIAQALSGSSITRTGAVMGTVQYLAPELVRGQPATPAVDIYGLGAVLYEMATGRVPFQGETDLAVALAHVEQPVPSARSLNPRVSEDLDLTIRRAMAKQPSDRFPSALDLARALRAPSQVSPTSRIPAAAGTAAQATRAIPRPSPTPAPPPRRGGPPPRPAPAARERVQSRPRQGGVGGGILALLLVLAAILALLGLGFFGMTWFSRGGGAPAGPPTPQPTTAPASPAPAAQPTAAPPTATPTTEPTPTAVPSPTITPTATVPASPTPAPTATPKPVAVPGVVGRNMEAAINALDKAGLRVTVKGVNVNRPQGEVVAIDPAEGTGVPPGTTVSLSVATGQLVVPKVVGKSAEEASRELVEAGLKPQIVTQPSDRPARTVLDTRPAGGETVQRGQDVQVVISAGR